MRHFGSKNIIPILFFSFGIFCSAFSQEKVEKETGIKSKEVPTNAKEWLRDAFENLRKPKWFIEYSQQGKSFEAKFKYNGHFLSVEFDSLGMVQDVEIEIKESEVPTEVWKAILAYFESEFDQVKVEKIQRQLIGLDSDLEDFFDQGEIEGVVFRYEIVFQGKSDLWELWEGLFDDQGAFLTKLKVQIRSNHNLIF